MKELKLNKDELWGDDPMKESEHNTPQEVKQSCVKITQSKPVTHQSELLQMNSAEDGSQTSPYSEETQSSRSDKNADSTNEQVAKSSESISKILKILRVIYYILLPTISTILNDVLKLVEDLLAKL